MERAKIAVIGSGVSGLGAAWLLSQRHRVVVFEADSHIGGHANTVSVETGDGLIDVDTGFIVYNAPNYPNLTALFKRLDVATTPTEMSFSVSLGNGAYEYSGSGVRGFFGQRRNLFNPAHWQMLKDISHFFKTAAAKSATLGDDVSLGRFLENERYSRAFIQRHILPMASAIWSAKPAAMLNYPAQSFISFYANHGMLQFQDRPLWRTVAGGSRRYVESLLRDGSFAVQRAAKIDAVVRNSSGVTLIDHNRASWSFDHVVIATHADQALAMLAAPTPSETELLKNFTYQSNRVVLHRDPVAMPKRRAVWASWNSMQPEPASSAPPCVTYWMNRLQALKTTEQFFVTLNPRFDINDDRVDGQFHYTHPLFTTEARRAQARLWTLQGQNHTWFCGSYFGHGFHEDGLQSGLAVAETLGGVRRPWRVANASGRICAPDYNAPSVRAQ